MIILDQNNMFDTKDIKTICYGPKGHKLNVWEQKEF